MKKLRLPNISLGKKPISPLLLAFLLPFGGLAALMLVCGYFPFGVGSFLYSDAYHQYYPFFVELREALLSGKGLQWTWSVGLGLDFLGLFAYYLASPLNWLAVLLPESMILGYFSFLLPIKLGFAGLFFALFLKKIFNRNDGSIALFGTFYATCAWALGYMWNIMWLDTFALLPLVMLGMVSLLEKRKFVLYTLTLFLSVVINYYVGFFVCIFVFLSFICYEICRFKSIKKLIIDLGLMAVFSVLALCMTAVLTLPAFMALQNTHSSVNTFPEEFKLNMVTEHNLAGLLEAMAKAAGNMNAAISPTFKEGLPNLYCGIGTIVLAFLMLGSKEVKLREKICTTLLLVFFLLSFAIRQLDYIWHGFHFTNMIPYRFSFLFSFVLLFMAYRAFTLWETFRPKQIVLAVSLAALLVLLSEKSTEAVFILFNFVLIMLYATVLLYRTKQMRASKKGKKDALLQMQSAHQKLCARTLAGVMVVELILNFVNFGMNFGGTNISYYPKGKENTEQAIDLMKELEKDNLFYRAETTHTQSLNDGALNGYNGITTFTSSAFVGVTEFMQALGYGAKDNYNRYCYEEASPVANLFLGIKYMLERDGYVEENSYFDEVARFDKVALLENNAYLPLGFLANSALADLEFPISGNRFTFQNNLVDAATGVDTVWSSTNNLTITAESGITLSNVYASGYCYYKAESGGKVTYTYTPEEEGFFCVYIHQGKRNSFSVRKNGSFLYNDSYSLPQMISVADVKPGDKIEIVFTVKAGESSSISLDNGILNEEKFRQAHSILNASTLSLTEFENTRISGTVDCNRDGLLYTSIPQNGNWIATVDGQVVETVQVGGAMLGIYMTEGTHTVEIVYKNDAFRAGVCMTVISFLIFGGIYLLWYKPRGVEPR
ncbi:MAG: YfhO family protein [Oscillospiraceae bacterium]|nr:YfhO family protein [Oscillospiraceae bacterium]